MPVSYRRAGVSIAAGDRVAAHARAAARRTRRPEVVAGVGGFGASFRVPRGYRRPLLVVSTDGVGTKLRVAFMAGRHDTVGIDLVAMSVNDVLTLGAEPVAFLDYYVTERLRPRIAAAVLDGIAAGCKLAGCALVGGETAEHPGCFTPGEYDLAGFVVGVVEEDEVVDGRRIGPGDVIIGLASSGLHSNGFSLVRHLCFERARLSLRARPDGLDRPLGEELLRPTRIYVPAVRPLPRPMIKGMAHITGGGIIENLPRILPQRCAARLRLGTWPRPPIFDVLQRLGDLKRDEMYRTFNMGIGFVLVVAARDADAVLTALARRRQAADVIGAVVPARRGARQRVELVDGGGGC
jgi:phosphoribosylformylglycinamidine cyclo-ligase